MVDTTRVYGMQFVALHAAIQLHFVECRASDRLIMALNVKQIVAIGLVVGVSSALGYRFLTRSHSKVAVKKEQIQLQSLNSFDLEPIELEPVESTSPQESDFDSIPPMKSVPDHNEFVEADIPKTDSLTEFQMDKVVGPADTLRLETEMAGPLSNSSPDSFDLSDLALAEPTLELESPSAPAEMQEPQFEEGSFDLVDLPSTTDVETDFNSPTVDTLPTVGTLGQPDTDSSSPRKSAGWNSNPFFKNSAPQSNSLVETKLPVATNNVSEASNNETNASFVSDELSLTAPDSSSPSGRSENRDPYLTNEAKPSNSVLSLNDPKRQAPQSESDVLEVRDEPKRDFSMLSEHKSVPLSEAEMQQAVHHIEYGKSLSRRGAGYSAREEFLRALQVLAEANDRGSRTDAHTQALREATLIMREAEDFSNGSAEQLIQMNIAKVIESHRSGILTSAEANKMTASNAIDRYFATAQQKLSLAGGRNAVSSEAFFCLGKLQSALPNNQTVPNPLDTAKSVVYHQAALMSDPNHHRSANELGVLFARSGRLRQAKQLFERSLLVQPHPQTWQNLATAHQRLGEHDFARRAENERVLLAQQGAPVTQVNWQPVEAFNAEAVIPVGERIATRPATVDSQMNSTESKEEPKSLSDRLKNLF